MSETVSRKRVVVFISGGGSNMLALADACADAAYPAEIVGVISDRSDAAGLAKAAARGIPTAAFERRDYADKAAHETAILDHVDTLKPDILCLAGYMRLLSAAFIQRHEGRILNIHPSLLPDFPGLHTHQRALDAGATEAGCTVHFVTEGMDEGPVILQTSVPVLAGDTAEKLAARVLSVEHRTYAQALRMVASGAARMESGQSFTAG